MRNKRWRPYCFPPGDDEIDRMMRSVGFRVFKCKTFLRLMDSGKYDPTKNVRHYFAPIRKQR